MKITRCKRWLSALSGIHKFFPGWFAGLYYWIYPGMMAAGVANELMRLT
jgi:hypothetical protein